MASSAGYIYINDQQQNVEYYVHPVVILSILDAYKRRSDKTENDMDCLATGTLLGEEVGNKVYIKECFAVPTATDGNAIFTDAEFREQMLALQRRVYPKIQVVGWYSTGQISPEHRKPIHDEHAELCRPSQPVFLSVDTNLTSDRLSIAAYRATEVKLGDSVVQIRYDRVPLELIAADPERVAADALTNDLPDSEAQLDAPATISGERQTLDRGIARLMENLESMSKYVSAVNAGEVEGDNKVGRAIAHAIATIPRMEHSVFDKSYADYMEDLLLVTHLASISARNQLDILDKLTAFLQ